MAAPFTADQTIYERPAELLQKLIRFYTTNPPGNEAQCVIYINSLLTDAGFAAGLIGMVSLEFRSNKTLFRAILRGG